MRLHHWHVGLPHRCVGLRHWRVRLRHRRVGPHHWRVGLWNNCRPLIQWPTKEHTMPNKEVYGAEPGRVRCRMFPREHTVPCNP